MPWKKEGPPCPPQRRLLTSKTSRRQLPAQKQLPLLAQGQVVEGHGAALAVCAVMYVNGSSGVSVMDLAVTIILY